MHNSIIYKRGEVTFPDFTGERIYMARIEDAHFPPELKRWEKTVNEMTRGMRVPLMYLMVDQAVVQAGATHRRPGLHVDGYWIAGGKHGHRPRAGQHSDEPAPRWGAEPLVPKPDVHSPVPSRHGSEPAPTPDRHSSVSSPGHGSDTAKWSDATFEYPESLLLASTHEGCRAYIGKCYGGIKEGGDCEDADVDVHHVVRMHPNFCYAGDVGTLHEAIPVRSTCKRTVVRLNIPGVRA